MFSKSMGAAVDIAQKRLMLTTNKESVLMIIANDLAELNHLVDILDPSNIDFDKGGLEKFKIKSYWKKFNNNYKLLNSILLKLNRSKNILYNSKINISNFYEDFKREYDKFLSTPDTSRDSDYMQQALVSENVNALLLDSIAEHETTYKHLDMVINTLEASLNIAIYLAAKNSSSNSDTSAMMIKKATTSDYQHEYSKLKSVLSE